jgi:hypothetical protein
MDSVERAERDSIEAVRGVDQDVIDSPVLISFGQIEGVAMLTATGEVKAGKRRRDTLSEGLGASQRRGANGLGDPDRIFDARQRLAREGKTDRRRAAGRPRDPNPRRSLGAAEYPSPDGQGRMLLVESAQSMANRLDRRRQPTFRGALAAAQLKHRASSKRDGGGRRRAVPGQARARRGHCPSYFGDALPAFPGSAPPPKGSSLTPAPSPWPAPSWHADCC